MPIGTSLCSGEEPGEISITSLRSPSTLVVPAEQLRDAENVKQTQKALKIRQNPLRAHSTMRGNEKG